MQLVAAPAAAAAAPAAFGPRILSQLRTSLAGCHRLLLAVFYIRLAAVGKASKPVQTPASPSVCLAVAPSRTMQIANMQAFWLLRRFWPFLFFSWRQIFEQFCCCSRFCFFFLSVHLWPINMQLQFLCWMPLCGSVALSGNACEISCQLMSYMGQRSEKSRDADAIDIHQHR